MGSGRVSKDIDKLVKLIAKLPSLGTRSSRRIVLQLLQRRDALFLPLIEALQGVAENIQTCSTCGNFDTVSPCSLCTDGRRKNGLLCVVQDVADLWALERVSFFKGRYHVLGGILSALDGVAPEDLNVEGLVSRIGDEGVTEVILALPATVDGQITAHYLTSRLKGSGVKVSTLAQGIPIGGELDYMDEGTLQMALNSRKSVL